MRRRLDSHRRDANSRAVVEALRAHGWVWLDLSQVGHGAPDGLAARRGVLKLVEIKDGSLVESRRRLTVDEARVHAAFAAAGVQVSILKSVEEALAL